MDWTPGDSNHPLMEKRKLRKLLGFEHKHGPHIPDDDIQAIINNQHHQSHRALLTPDPGGGWSIQKVYFNKRINTMDRRRFENEIRMLTELEENFTNTPKLDYYPFPKILSIDHKKCLTTMTYCGPCLNKTHGSEAAHNWAKDKPNTIVNEVNDIIECIINNLTNNLIIYSDIHPGNICINNNNLFLIDFDSAYFLRKSSPEATREFYSDFYDKKHIMLNDRNRKISVESMAILINKLDSNEDVNNGTWRPVNCSHHKAPKPLKAGANIWHILTMLELPISPETL